MVPSEFGLAGVVKRERSWSEVDSRVGWPAYAGKRAIPIPLAPDDRRTRVPLFTLPECATHESLQPLSQKPRSGKLFVVWYFGRRSGSAPPSSSWAPRPFGTLQRGRWQNLYRPQVATGRRRLDRSDPRRRASFSSGGLCGGGSRRARHRGVAEELCEARACLAADVAELEL
jgi:hypothetical protein